MRIAGIFFIIDRNISVISLLLIEIFLSLQCQTINEINIMKYSEFHRKILAAGWKFSHAEGSHYFYKKNGKLSEPVPYHGAKEFPEPLRRKIARAMGI